MEFKEIEQKLWSEFLNRLQVEKNASPSSDVVFLLDKESFEGVNLYQFQSKALAKLLDLGALASMGEYRRRSNTMRIIDEINQQMNPSLPDGYTLRFSGEKFKSVLTRLRHSIANGDIHQEPAFELSLKKLSLIVTDLETGEERVVHKMKLDSQVQDVFEYVFNQQSFDVEKEELVKARLEVRGGLNTLINVLRLPPLVRKAFFKTSKNRLIIYNVVFNSDLERMDIDIDGLRKELIESDNG